MKINENIWVKATHGYFSENDTAIFDIKDTVKEVARLPYGIEGKENGSVSMNGLVVAGALALARGNFHFFSDRNSVKGKNSTWAEFVTKPDMDAQSDIYLINIESIDASGIRFRYNSVKKVYISRLDREREIYVPAFDETEVEKMPYAPYLTILPRIIYEYSVNSNVADRIDNLRHMPEEQYDENPDLYWLSDYFFTRRSEHYTTMQDIEALDSSYLELFIDEKLKLLRDWELYSFYNSESGLVPGSIGNEDMAVAFSGDSVDPSLEELIPDMDMGDYYLDPKVKSVIDMIILEKDSKIPITTGMFYGPPASGKSTAVKLMANLLRLPYIPVTFNSNITMDDLLGSWQPTEDGKIRFRESLFVRAYESPSVVEFVECYYVKPGACGDLNTALDETAQITLPDGRIVHRHPHCFIVATINAGENEQDYRAVREQDASFDRRFEGFKEYLEPFDRQIFAGLIKKQSGYDDDGEIMLMIRAMNDINKKASETGDWQTVYPSSVIRWAQHRKYKDIFNAADATVLPAASKNLDIQDEIRETILRKYW